ncbi:MAG: carbohydrate-binding protein [Cyclobacteriaceae bacterium]
MKTLISVITWIMFTTSLFGQNVNVTDFGATPDDASDNDRTAILNAIDACRSLDNPVLYFPTGTYHLNSEEQSGTYFYVEGIDNLTIDGDGSTIEVLGKSYNPHLFEFVRCENLRVENIKVDYQDPPFSQGSIIDAGSNFMVVQIHEGFTTEGKSIQAYAEYDSLTRQMANGNERYGNTEWQWEDQSKNIIRIMINANGYQAGSWILLRHTLYTGYSFITSTGCKDVVYDGVTVYISPGYAFLGNNGAENISYLNCRIEAKEGFWVTTTADGSHNLDVRGTLIFDNCYFEHMSDDGINLHGYFLDVVNKIDEYTIDIDGTNPSWYQAIGYLAGDTIEFIDKFSLNSLGYREITNISNKNGNSMRLAFSEPIPDGAITTFKVANVSIVGKLRVTNSTFRANRARGVLVSTRDVLIENCTFERNLMWGIFFDVSTYWNESKIGRDVIIRNNTFDDSGYFRSGTDYGVINFHPDITSSHVRCDVFGDITITGNTFRNIGIPAIYAQNIDGLVITDNVIESAADGRNSIRYRNCTNVTIENNSGAEVDEMSGSCVTETPDVCYAIPGKIEAESFHDMSGVQIRETPDAGGGFYLGWTDSGDWMMYKVCVESSSWYTLSFRVASESRTSVINVSDQDGNLLGTVNTPSTGNWGNYVTVDTEMQISTDVTELVLDVVSGTFDLNWIDIEFGEEPVSEPEPLFAGLGHDADKLTLYPNPCNNELYFSGVLPNNGALQIFELSGRGVFTTQISSATENVNFDLQPGLYLVKISDEQGVIKTQLIKNNLK